MVIVAAEPAEVQQLLISRLKVRFLPRSPNLFNGLPTIAISLHTLLWLFLWLLGPYIVYFC